MRKSFLHRAPKTLITLLSRFHHSAKNEPNIRNRISLKQKQTSTITFKLINRYRKLSTETQTEKNQSHRFLYNKIRNSTNNTKLLLMQ